MSTPAVEIRSFAVDTPAGTLQATPLITPIYFPAREVTEIHWRVPPGPAGNLGWKLTMSGGQNVLPVNGTYIVTDNRSDVWPVINQPNSGYWEVTSYNTDIYDHTVYLDFFLTLVSAPGGVTELMSNAALSSPPPPPSSPSSPSSPPPVNTAAIAARPAVHVG